MTVVLSSDKTPVSIVDLLASLLVGGVLLYLRTQERCQLPMKSRGPAQPGVNAAATVVIDQASKWGVVLRRGELGLNASAVVRGAGRAKSLATFVGVY